MKYKKINNVSSEAVEKATGKGWSEWIRFLDKKSANKMSHKQIAKMLQEKNYVKSGWWAQTVTVAYEYAKGRRVVGQTKTAGFEIGAQKMMYLPKQVLWKFLTSSKGLELWLGKGAKLKLIQGYKFKTKGGLEIEIKTFKKGERMRLSFKPKDWKQASTLQVTLFCPRDTSEKTNIRFHQEKLSGVPARNQMRTHWKKVLENISKNI